MGAEQSTLVSSEHLEVFQRNGVVCLRQVFDQKWLDLVAVGIARNLSAPSAYAQHLKAGGDTGRFFGDYCNWHRIQEFRAFVYDSPAAALAAQLMSSEKVIFYHEHLLIKEPGTQKETPWHHDQPYYPIDGWQACSMWMPLDPVPRTTCVQFVKGSHRWGALVRATQLQRRAQLPVQGSVRAALGRSPVRDRPRYCGAPRGL